jgi:hypothetical protein
VIAALAVAVADIGILHGWIRPHQRRYGAVVERLESPPADPTGSREDDVAALKSLEKQVGLGWGLFNVLVIGAVYLMVFQPGH